MSPDDRPRDDSRSKGREDSSNQSEGDPSNSEGGGSSQTGDSPNSETERWSSLETPTPRYMTDTDKRIFAFRRYYGLGPDGRKMEEWTQQRIADYLGVSRQTVDRWLNREPMPLVEDMTRRERWTLYSIVARGDGDGLDEYLMLRDLEEDGEPSQLRNVGVGTSESNPGPSLFDGIDEDNLW